MQKARIYAWFDENGQFNRVPVEVVVLTTKTLSSHQLGFSFQNKTESMTSSQQKEELILAKLETIIEFLRQNEASVILLEMKRQELG